MARRDLKIYVSADTRGTVRATSAASKSFGKLQGAAVAAGGAMAAGLAFGAKKAFDEFRDAEKVTNQTNAALKSTRGQAKVTAKEIENLASKISLKSGIDDEAIQSGQNLLLTFTKIRNEVGKGNDIFDRSSQVIVDMSVALDQDLKSSAIQVGKALNDPVKGMTALQRVGVSFTEDQKERVKGWVEEGKRLKAQRFILKELTTEFGGSAAAQADSADKLKVAWDNIFEAIGKAFGPILLKASGKLAKFIRQMENGKGAGGDFVDALEDLRDTAKGIGETIGPPLKAIGEFALKHKTVTAMAVALGLFAKGWAGLRGGGPGKLGGIGQALGAVKPIPVFVTNPGFGGGRGGVPVPTGGPGGGAGKTGRLGKLLPILGPAGAIWGFTFAVSQVGPKVSREEARFGGGSRDAVRNVVSARGGAPAAQEQARRIQESKRQHSDWANHVKRQTERVSEAYERTGSIQTRVFSKSERALADLRMHTAREMGRIRDRFRDDSEAGRAALARNFERAGQAAKRVMDRTGRVTRSGLDFVKDMFVQELRLYGLNPRQALASANVRTGEVRGGFRRQDFQTGGKLQYGGIPVPGYGQGDKVHMQAMVEPGEQVFVLNRNASAALGALQSWNSMVPRFARGGMVDPAWDPGSERLAGSISGTVGAWARRYKANMTAGYDPGGGHVSPGHNVTGTATDMVPLYGDWDLLERGLRVLTGRGLKVLYGSNGVGIPFPNHGRGNHAHIEWGSARGLGGFASKFKRVDIRGRGPLRDMLQAGVNAARRGAQRRANRAIGAAFTDGTGGVGAGGQYGKRQLANLWTRAGGDPKLSNLMAAIALAESGGNPQAHNPSGASGLWQILGQIVPGNVFNPLVNARNAVAKYRSQGLGAWEAYTNGNYRQYLRRGGLVRGLRRGGRPKRKRKPVGVTDPFSFIPGTINAGERTRIRRLNRQALRDRRSYQRYLRRMRSPEVQGSALGEIFSTRSGQFAADQALASLTETTTDDIAAAEAEAKFWESWLPVAQASGDAGAISTAATGLKAARDTLADLRGASQSQADLAEEIKALRESIDAQTKYFTSVEGISSKVAIRALADNISGQIAGPTVSRARSAGDGVTGARY